MRIVKHRPAPAKKDSAFYSIFPCDRNPEPGNLLYSLQLVKKVFVEVLDLSVRKNENREECKGPEAEADA